MLFPTAYAGCDSNPCLNDATCVEPVDDAFVCQCADGYTGFNCETGQYCII